jgi:DNA-binding MurR/RpiR family transcriptional regulator
MNARSLPNLIESIMETLTPAEKRVARVLLGNYPVAGLQTLVDVARMASTSHPTVLRLIRKLGFASYPEFQGALRGEVERQYKIPWSRPLPSKTDSANFGVALQSLNDAMMHNIETFMATVPKSEIYASARKCIECSGRIYVVAADMSHAMADHLYRSIRLATGNVELIDPSPGQFAHALQEIGKKDVVCAIHMPRYDTGIQRFSEQATEKGASLILFTDDILSPLAARADHVMSAPINVPSMFDSYVVTMMQIEIMLFFMINLNPKAFKSRNDLSDSYLSLFK